MATRLAQAGVLTCVLAYSLYPQAHAPTMVSEVSNALTWVLDHVSTFGGDPAKVRPAPPCFCAGETL
jgi:acetyl esterase/lipase